MNKKALEYGKLACDTMMRKFKAEDLPPKGGFHYHAGVFLAGMMDIYSVCGDEKYFNYAKEWVDSIIPETAVTIIEFIIFNCLHLLFAFLQRKRNIF